MTRSDARLELRIEARGARHAGERGLPDWYERLTLFGKPLGGEEEVVLFQGNWELRPLVSWLRECESQIRDERTPISQRPGETLGQTLARAYDAVTEDLPDDVFDLAIYSVNHYNRTHNLSVGASGMADFPRLLIGRGSDGHEICNWIADLDRDEAWRYLVDIDDFFASLPAEQDC